jgi:uncharacterized protein YbjT (DUF2867 family)
MVVGASGSVGEALLARLMPVKLRPIRTNEIARAMVAAASQPAPKSAVYHCSEMKALIARR